MVKSSGFSEQSVIQGRYTWKIHALKILYFSRRNKHKISEFIFLFIIAQLQLLKILKMGGICFPGTYCHLIVQSNNCYLQLL